MIKYISECKQKDREFDAEDDDDNSSLSFSMDRLNGIKIVSFSNI
jgi:hypothetical protein